MDQVTPDQAQALWSAGGFIVLSDLPVGSEFGIDGTYHIVRKFSGIKFVPPGLHLITWSPPTGDSGPSTIPLRSSLLRWFQPKERLLLRYDPVSESVEYVEGIITDDRLKALDIEMAPYPFESLAKWKSLITHLTPGVVDRVMGKRRQGRVDGMTGVQGVEEEDTRLNPKSGMVEREEKLMFPTVGRRSWRDGAIGEEITKYSKDKSWQFGDVVKDQGGDPMTVLAHLQLAFILLLNLSSYSALQIYQRLLTLFTRSHSLLSTPEKYLESQAGIRTTYIALINTLSAQLLALPDQAFDAELPEMDVFYLDEIESLRQGLVGGIGRDDTGIVSAWDGLRKSAKRWGWTISPLLNDTSLGEEEESDEEGEYAPQVVDL